MDIYRYDIRNHEVGRNSRASRRCDKCVLLVLCLCALQPVFAAIVMETPQTEVKIFLTDRKEERNNTPLTSLQLPLCSIVITAKHYGKGYLQIFHTPLVNEVESVPYQLFCDYLQKNFPDVLSYSSSPYLPFTIPMTKLSANLARPLLGDWTSYSSNVIVHLKLDV